MASILKNHQMYMYQEYFLVCMMMKWSSWYSLNLVGPNFFQATYLFPEGKRFDRENVDAKLIKFADIFIYLYFIKQSLSKRKVSGMTMMQKRILACECFTGWIVASWRGGKIPGTDS